MMKKIFRNLDVEFYVTLFLALLSGFFLIDGAWISHLNETAFRFPRLTFGAIILLCLVQMIVLAVKAWKATDDYKKKPAIQNKKNFFVGCALVICTALLFWLFGLFAAIVITTIIYGFMYKYPKKWVLVIYAFALAGIIVFTFSNLLGVPLPEGIVIKALF